MKRYDFYCSYDGGGPAEETEDENGGYVRYEDAQAEIERLKAKNQRLLTLNGNLTDKSNRQIVINARLEDEVERLRAENERLRAALADVAHSARTKTGMKQIATRALYEKP